MDLASLWEYVCTPCVRISTNTWDHPEKGSYLTGAVGGRHQMRGGKWNVEHLAKAFKLKTEGKRSGDHSSVRPGPRSLVHVADTASLSETQRCLP